VAQVAEHLPDKLKTLIANPSTTKTKTRQKNLLQSYSIEIVWHWCKDKIYRPVEKNIKLKDKLLHVLSTELQ
jgi:hypothetical protein